MAFIRAFVVVKGIRLTLDRPSVLSKRGAKIIAFAGNNPTLQLLIYTDTSLTFAKLSL